MTGHGSASLKISGHRAELIVQHFAAPPSGKIYEVWLVHGKQAPQPTSALFDVNADGNTAVDVPGSLEGRQPGAGHPRARRRLQGPDARAGDRRPTQLRRRA